MKDIAEQLDALGVEINHHFVGGLYAKEAFIPAGTCISKHVHTHDHLSALMLGKVLVDVDGVVSTLSAPALVTIRAGSLHKVTALTDVTWVCFHKTDETDPSNIDEVLVS